MRGWTWTIAGALLLAAAPRPAVAQGPFEVEKRGTTEPARREAAARAAERGWLGISFTATEVTFRHERGRTRTETRGSVVIEDVYPGSPAEKAGVQRGDTVVRVNGKAEVGAELTDRDRKVGDRVTLRLRRAGKERDAVVVAGERPARLARAPRPPGMPRAPGARRAPRAPGGEDVIIIRRGPNGAVDTLRTGDLRTLGDSLHHNLRIILEDSLRPQLRAMEREVRRLEADPEVRARVREVRERAQRFPEQLAFGVMGDRAVAGAELAPVSPELGAYFGTRKGVLVIRVAPDTPAARAGLEAGDVVLRADGTELETPRDLRRVLLDADDREVRLQYLRKEKRRETTLRWRS